VSTPAPFPNRTPLRAALLDFIAAAGPRPTAEAGMGAEEQEFIEALRRIVAQTGADELRDRLLGRRPDPRARIYGRYAD
jgi:hypothetical protein